MLRHRVVLTYEAEAEEVTAEDIVRRVFEASRSRRLAMLPRELIKKLRAHRDPHGAPGAEPARRRVHSVFKGRGMAFSEVRQYQPGDDVRIDRLERHGAHERGLRQAVRRRARDDGDAARRCVGSGAFGTREQAKREVAAEVAALLAFTAIRNNDRVGLIIFTDRVEKFVPPKKGKQARAARHHRDPRRSSRRRARTDLRVGLEFLGRWRGGASVAFLCRDFIVDGGTGAYEKALRIAKRKHDLVPVTITDPMEEELPDVGYVYFEDVETGEVVAFDTAGPGRERYRGDGRGERATSARRCFRRHIMDFVNVRTDAPYVGALIAFFRAREHAAAPLMQRDLPVIGYS